MTEAYRSQPLSRLEAEQMGVPDPFLATFESRLAHKKPFEKARRKAIQLNPALTIITTDKFAPAVLWLNDEGAEILLGDGSESRYDMGAHSDICRQNGVKWDLSAYSVSLLIVGDRRFISASFLPRLSESNLGKLKSILQRYRIEAVFAPKHNFDHDEALGTGITNEPHQWGINWLSLTNYTEAMDNLIRDDWTSQVAQTYGLTNTEFLRMRLTGKLPEDKRTPIGKSLS